MVKKAVVANVAGKNVDLSALTKYQSMPSLASVRSVWSQHLTQGLTPDLLAGYLIESENGFPWNWLDICEDMLEKYPHATSCLGTRIRAYTRISPTIEDADKSPEQKTYSQFIRDNLLNKKIKKLMQDMGDGLFKGFAVIETIWDTDGPEGTWVPKEFKRVDPRFFAIDPNDGETLYLRDNAGFFPLPPFKYIIHKPKFKAGIMIRGGLARGVCWPYVFQNYGEKFALQFQEVCGMPLRVGKYGVGATAEDIAALKLAVGAMGTDGAAIIPQDYDIAFAGGATAGASEIYRDAFKRQDDKVSKLILGQTHTAGGQGKAGGLGHSSDEGENVRVEITEDDAGGIEETICDSVIQWMIDLNWPGKKEKYPKLKLPIEDPDDMDKLSKIVTAGVQAGARVSEDWFLNKIGAPPFEEGKRYLSLGGVAAPSAPGIPGKPSAAPSVETPSIKTAPEPAMIPPNPVIAPIEAPEDDAATAYVDRIMNPYQVAPPYGGQPPIVPIPPPAGPVAWGQVLPPLAANVRTAKVEDTKIMVSKVKRAMARYRSPGYQAKLANRISKAADEAQDITAILAAEIRKAAKS